jgi:hypothetical protein
VVGVGVGSGVGVGVGARVFVGAVVAVGIGVVLEFVSSSPHAARELIAREETRAMPINFFNFIKKPPQVFFYDVFSSNKKGKNYCFLNVTSLL